jgi:hypothetical protein
MKRSIFPIVASLAAASSAPGVVVVLSDTEAPGAELETWIQGAFSNVTEIRHGNYANFTASTKLEASTEPLRWEPALVTALF